MPQKATLVHTHLQKNHNCTIVSSDSDFIQLIQNDNVTLYNPVKKEAISYPDYDYVVWKSLRGDPTDNIKGIPGVGDKTALKLVSDNVLLKQFLNKPENMRIFEENVNLIRLVDFSNDLSTLEYKTGGVDFEKLKSSFEEMGFNSMTKSTSWQKYVETFKGVSLCQENT